MNDSVTIYKCLWAREHQSLKVWKLLWLARSTRRSSISIGFSARRWLPRTMQKQIRTRPKFNHYYSVSLIRHHIIQLVTNACFSMKRYTTQPESRKFTSIALERVPRAIRMSAQPAQRQQFSLWARKGKNADLPAHEVLDSLAEPEAPQQSAQ